MPRTTTFFYTIAFSFSIFFIDVISPGYFIEALDPDNFYRFYKPIILMAVPPCFVYIVEFNWIATCGAQPSLVRGRLMFVIVLFMFVVFFVCFGFYFTFATVDAGAAQMSPKALAILSFSDTAFKTMCFVVSSVLVACGAFNLIIHRRQSAKS